MDCAYLLLIRTFVSVFLVSGFLSGGSVTFPTGWPKSVTYPNDITVEIVQEVLEAEGSIYRSNHFELISDYPLALEVLCDILRVAEANYASLQALPLGFDHTHGTQLHRVKLIKGEYRYVQRGGVMGTGGVYLPANREALIRIDTIGARMSDEGRIAAIQHLGLIAHEITHQLQHEWLEVLPTWLTEGLAVYLESVPFQNGVLLFDKMDFRLEKNLQRCSENRYWITDIEKLMTIARKEWNQHFEKYPESNDRHYVSAFLLTYYFLHLSGNEADTALRSYIESMKEAEDSEARASALSALMQGRSYQELEEDMINAYAQNGFKLQAFIDSLEE